MKNILSFKRFKSHWPHILSVIFFILLFVSYARIFAIGSPYAPGATLDPACSPGSTNCIVQTLPSQTGHPGEFLTTDGTTTSWAVGGGGGTARTSGDTGTGYLNYNGTTSSSGQFDGGITNPSHTTRLNYDGNFYTNSLNVSGDILPSTAPVNNDMTTTIVDSTGNVGGYSSLAIGMDGFARISYYDLTNQNLKFAQCTNDDCTTNVLTIIDHTGGASSSSITIDSADTFARISYYDPINKDLKFVQCTNDACSTNVITSVDTTGDVGQEPSVAISPNDDYARIAYYDITNKDLKYVQCTNDSCSTNVITPVDTTGDVGGYSSMALAPDDYARITYYDGTNQGLKYVQCTSDDCSTKNITSISVNSAFYLFSFALGTDGYARIVYSDDNSYMMKFAKCTNADCTTKNITPINIVGYDPSLALAADGYARIVYLDNTSTKLRFTQCTDDDCATNNTTTLDSTGQAGYWPFIGINSTDNSSQISHYDNASRDLKFLRLANSNIVAFTGGSNIGSSTIPFNSVYATELFSKQSLIGYFDLAENYPTKDITLDAGNIVSLNKDNPVFVKKADNTERVIGIVSTMPGSILGGYNDELYKDEKKVPIALSGRVPVKVNLENGPIAIGDDISLSSTNGYGKKAKSNEDTVGIALESFNDSSSNDSILVFVHLQTQIPNLNLNVPDLSSIDTSNAASVGELIKQFLSDQANGIGDFFANIVHTKEICVAKSDGTEFCANGDQLEAVIKPETTSPDIITVPETSTVIDPIIINPISPDPIPSDITNTPTETLPTTPPDNI
jgi:hypothetical protein